jgi:hypothetical protein
MMKCRHNPDREKGDGGEAGALARVYADELVGGVVMLPSSGSCGRDHAGRRSGIRVGPTSASGSASPHAKRETASGSPKRRDAE